MKLTAAEYSIGIGGANVSFVCIPYWDDDSFYIFVQDSTGTEMFKVTWEGLFSDY
ncbi:hypothetical protein [Breznakiella homolactica]|uniref:Uncharacterized protein n=1 Tax=Breznakiella homolactica TaxID=2798577 RepID=A0A7T8BBF1_9SPIR|nr:hypothetical protein [Breznakiella homolactica]QQO09168.1 hypothetical protein JFL75_19920 [Breznakiella homolactica]